MKFEVICLSNVLVFPLFNSRAHKVWDRNKESLLECAKADL